jgi:hypothetical protein
MILQLIATKPHLIIKENYISQAQSLIKIPVTLQSQMDNNII